MTPKRALVSLALVLAVLLALIARAPASLLSHALPAQAPSVAWAGTLWNGTAVASTGDDGVELAWTVLPMALAEACVRARVLARATALRASAIVERCATGPWNIVASELDARGALDAPLAGRLAAPLSLAGNVVLRGDRLAWSADALRLSAQARWEPAVVVAPVIAELGVLSLRAESLADRTRIAWSNAQSPASLSGALDLLDGGDYALELAVTPGEDEGWRTIAGNLATPDASGTHRIELAGPLSELVTMLGLR